MADKYFYRDSVTTKVRYTRGQFEGWTEPSGLLNAPYAIFRTAKTVIYVPQYSLMAETRQRLPQPGQPPELEKRFQEGIKESEDFATRFLAEHGEAGNMEYFREEPLQPVEYRLDLMPEWALLDCDVATCCQTIPIFFAEVLAAKTQRQRELCQDQARRILHPSA